MFEQLDDLVTKSLDKEKGLPWPSWKYLWLAIPWTIGCIYCLIGFCDDNQIAKRQSIVQASYSAYDLDNHHQCRYQFLLDNKRFEGEGFCPDTLPKLGDSLMVYYDRKDPTMNSPISFDRGADQELGPVILMVGGISILVLAIGLSKRQERNRMRPR